MSVMGPCLHQRMGPRGATASPSPPPLHPATLSLVAMCTFWSPLPAGAAMQLVQLARADGMQNLAMSVISLVNPRWQGSFQSFKQTVLYRLWS